MNCESLPSAMIGDTVPDPDRELRSEVRSTQDPEKEVGVSDILTGVWSQMKTITILCDELGQKCTWEVSNYETNSDAGILKPG